VCVVGRDKTPLVFSNIIHLAAHVVVTTYDVDFVLKQETLVGDS
jgi:hypothetical protein